MVLLAARGRRIETLEIKARATRIRA